MKRVERLTGIITFLQSRNHTSIDRLVEKFGVSERTIYRDLASLYEIGVPITFEKDRGYMILDTHFIPPVSFSAEEAMALTLAGRLMKRFSDYKTNVHFDNAMDKVRYALDTGQKEMVDGLTDSDRVHDLFPVNREENPLFAIQSSILRKRILKIKYRNRREEISEREIEPVGLTFYGGQWHVVAWCWMRSAYRDFIVSSMLVVNETAYPFRKYDHATLDDYIEKMLKAWKP